MTGETPAAAKRMAPAAPGIDGPGPPGQDARSRSCWGPTVTRAPTARRCSPCWRLAALRWSAPAHGRAAWASGWWPRSAGARPRRGSIW
jgi:hypothetical protein